MQLPVFLILRKLNNFSFFIVRFCYYVIENVTKVVRRWEWLVAEGQAAVLQDKVNRINYAADHRVTFIFSLKQIN